VQLEFFEGASVAPCLQDASAQTFPAHQFRLITPSCLNGQTELSLVKKAASEGDLPKFMRL